MILMCYPSLSVICTSKMQVIATIGQLITTQKNILCTGFTISFHKAVYMHVIWAILTHFCILLSFILTHFSHSFPRAFPAFFCMSHTLLHVISVRNNRMAQSFMLHIHQHSTAPYCVTQLLVQLMHVLIRCAHSHVHSLLKQLAHTIMPCKSPAFLHDIALHNRVSDPLK